MRDKILQVIKDYGPIGARAIGNLLGVSGNQIQVEIYNNHLGKEKLNFVNVKGSTKFTIKTHE